MHQVVIKVSSGGLVYVGSPAAFGLQNRTGKSACATKPCNINDCSRGPFVRGASAGASDNLRRRWITFNGKRWFARIAPPWPKPSLELRLRI
jgi:hypothetical protein